jgi:hypothetical protein
VGFVKLKMQNKLGAPVAFVDFEVYYRKGNILFLISINFISLSRLGKLFCCSFLVSTATMWANNGISVR